jgi:signal transduction histidine kinase
LAVAEPMVAAAAVSAAQLSDDQWLDLIPALPIRARGIVRHRRGLAPRIEALLRRLGINDRGLPPAEEPVPSEEAIEGIGAIVRRIEQFRRSRQQLVVEPGANDAPRLPLDDTDDDARLHTLQAFDFATDAEGRIVWSDPAAAPMTVGLRLPSADADSPVQASARLVAAFRRRQPIRGELLHIDGAPAVAGAWQADAAPRFDRPGGRFIGYCGRLRRPVTEPPAIVDEPAAESEADRMRQILHELRTPVNAIQGFAEVIQQQLFGPTPHEYRALAATIASDGARMLAGFEELDRLVKLDCGALDLDAGICDIAAVVAMTVAQLEPYGTPRGSGFAFEQAGDQPDEPVPVALARGEAERLAWRLLATLAGAAAPGEVLKLKIRAPRGDLVRIFIRLPASLDALGDEDLFHAAAPPQPQALSAGMFGTGFALRLAAAEAQAAGGSLERNGGKLRLSLPVPAPSAAGRPLALDVAAKLRGQSD